MSTPQRSKTPAATPLSKDSPTSIFFDNLSPIQVISSKLISQAFDNIDVLSPQPVFATPQNRLTNLKLRKRSQSLAFHSPQKICPSDAVVATTSLQHPDTTRRFIPVETVELSNCSDRKYKTDDHPHAEVCSIPTNGVDEFLSIPIDDCENSSCSPGYLLGDACDLVLDKDTAPVSTNRDQVVCPNGDSVQVPSIKSPSTVTNYVAECTEHRELVIMTDEQPNEAVLSQEFRNNSIVYERPTLEFFVSNAEESFNINAVDQNLTYQPEHNPDMHMPNCQTVSATFEKFDNLGGPVGKKIEENLNSLIDSDSCAQNEPITLDREEPIVSCVPNTMNFRNADHVDGCPSTSGSYLLGIQDVEFRISKPLGHLDSVYDEKCEILSNNQLHYHHHGISRQLKDEPAKGQITYDQEDVPHHSRGMYKRLQFEDVGKKERCVACTENGTNLKSSCFMSATETMPSIMESSNASTSTTITIPAKIPKVQLPSGNISGNHLSNTNFLKQSRERCTAVVPRTFGIGLHLNAIGTSGQMSCPMDSSGSRAKAISPNGCEVTSQPLNNTILTRNREASVQLNSNSDDSSFGSMGECNSELYPKLLDSVPDCHSPFDVEPLDMCRQPEFSDHHITPCSRIRLPSVEEVSFQNSLGKKRKKAPEIEGQKRCNCKRSKCLKLYCDCFAAGVFCNDACACQGCSNNCENEETVSSTRQQIEARNPLAFAPRVVHANGGLNDSVDNKHITPPSARHKRGCNCKKSKCLKKYCECFQAGVGCSLACRCEGCKNAFGTKEACGDITEMILEHQKPKGDGLDRESSAGTLEVIMNVNSQKVPNTKRFSPPPAPLMQCTKVNSVVARLHIIPASCHPSLESKFTSVPSLDSSTSMNQTRHNSLHADINEEALSVVPYPARSSSSGPSPSLCESSAPKTEHAKIYSSKLVHHCSPAPKQGRLGEGRFIIRPVVDGLHCLLTDETPEILNSSSRSPIKTVKISSPNQKRVSPPKKPLLKAGSSFSAGLRSGRKYVLSSIPQFPSLTPYRNSYKDNGIESSSKIKGNGRHSENNSSKTDIPMLESQL